MKLVILETPFAGDTERNIRFARACMRDSLLRGEAPFAGHLLYTQEGILDDKLPDERARGIEAHLAWGRLAVTTVVYMNFGVSVGMSQGIRRAFKERRRVEYRILENFS